MILYIASHRSYAIIRDPANLLESSRDELVDRIVC
jgi:hypothetical protein